MANLPLSALSLSIPHHQVSIDTLPKHVLSIGGWTKAKGAAWFRVIRLCRFSPGVINIDRPMKTFDFLSHFSMEWQCGFSPLHNREDLGLPEKLLWEHPDKPGAWQLERWACKGEREGAWAGKIAAGAKPLMLVTSRKQFDNFDETFETRVKLLKYLKEKCKSEEYDQVSFKYFARWSPIFNWYSKVSKVQTIDSTV